MIRLEIAMTNADSIFHAGGWNASSKEEVLLILDSHLQAAAVVWPELKTYEIRTERSRK
jgi:hypothetical protein